MVRARSALGEEGLLGLESGWGRYGLFGCCFKGFFAAADDVDLGAVGVEGFGHHEADAWTDAP